MSLQNDDLFLVNRGGESFKTEYGLLKNSINEDEGVVIGDNPPSDPHDGDLWYNSEDGRLYVWYVNETSGVVTSVSLRNGGSGYTSDETDVETSGGLGHGLTVDIDAGTGGNFANPRVNQGGHGYAQGDYIVVTGAGHGNGTMNVTAVNSVSVGQWVDASPDGGSGDSLWEESSGKLYPKTLTNNVGIGTNNPEYKLDLVGNQAVRRNSGSDQRLDFYCEGTGNYIVSHSPDTAQKDLILKNAHASKSIVFNTGGSSNLGLAATGDLTLYNGSFEVKAGNISASNIVTGTTRVVSGGDIRCPSTDASGGKNAGVRILSSGTYMSTVAAQGTTTFKGYFLNNANPTSSITGRGTFTSDLYVDANTGTAYCFNAKVQALGGTLTTGVGYYSNIAADQAKVTNPWAMYHAGTAGSYFNGGILVGNTSSKPYCRIGTRGGIYLERPGGNTEEAPIVIRRTNSNTTSSWLGIEFYKKSESTRCGFVKLSGASTRTIDTRLGATGVAMADGAADIVKALQPKVITQGGETFTSFLPADLAGTFDEAVDGEAGATVAIGTYTDPEGVVETDVEEPEAIPYGATWEQTGIKDLMQGVCREDLIPLLTKALQEAIAKNEELEARLAAIEANEVVDDATDSALLTLVAGLAQRVTDLEGGN